MGWGYIVTGLDRYVKEFTDLCKPEYAKEAEPMLEDCLEACEVWPGPFEVILEEEKTEAGIPVTFTFDMEEKEEGPDVPVTYIGHHQ